MYMSHGLGTLGTYECLFVHYSATILD